MQTVYPGLQSDPVNPGTAGKILEMQENMAGDKYSLRDLYKLGGTACEDLYRAMGGR